ncbi:MAG: hypothetical protein IT445_06610 [Phycisphaeraceae bacterium]|nr:hypothetical protein [Phycisphaeraceae bacterium]
MSSPQTPDSALRLLRVIWAAMLLGIIALAGLALTFAGGQPNNADAAFDIDRIQIGLLIGMVVTVALAHVIRLQIYKRHWRDYAILPQGYFLGNLILFALLEGFIVLNLVMMLVAHQAAALALPAAIMLVLFVINFPTGSMMFSNRRLS